MRPPQIHDGPPALNVRAHGALPRTLNPQLSTPTRHLWPEGGGGAKTSQTQTTATTDNRIATEGEGNQVFGSNTIGGSLTINTLADDVALGALDTAGRLGSDALDTAGRLGSDALDTAVDLTRSGADTVTQLAAGALEGFQSLLDSNQRTASDAFSLVSSSAANSAAGARQVADSQKEFLRAQTGQDTALKLVGYALAAVTVGGIAYAVVNSRKSK